MNVGKMAGMAVVALLLGVGAVQAGITIVTVPVGNPGNAADKRYDANGFGSVSYIYNIGKYEVTAAQYTAFLNAVAKTDTYGLYDTFMWSSAYGCKIQRSGSSGSYSYTVDPNRANRPVNYVSWGDAARFANWLHNSQPTGAQSLTTTENGAYYLNAATSNAQLLAVTRKAGAKWAIISEGEWYKAAYYDPNKSGGPGYWDYPTRTNSKPSNVVTSPDPGNNANYYGDGTGGFSIGSPYYRTIVGEFENSASPYGTFDQGGNVFEWTEAILYSSYRGLRGGSFDANDDFLSAPKRYKYYPSDGDWSVGFRVSEVPEPATMAVLALGGIGMLIRRRGLVKCSED